MSFQALELDCTNATKPKCVCIVESSEEKSEFDIEEKGKRYVFGTNSNTDVNNNWGERDLVKKDSSNIAINGLSSKLNIENDCENDVGSFVLKQNTRPQLTKYERVPKNDIGNRYELDCLRNQTNAEDEKDGYIKIINQSKNQSKNQSSLRRCCCCCYCIKLTHQYWKILKKYPMYRAYFMSHICQNIGDWFVSYASLSLLEEISFNGRELSYLATSTLLPQLIFAHFGGFLSDRYDRRRCMIFLDILGGLVVLGYLAALHYHSLSLLYSVKAIRSILAATYYPISKGILPMFIPNVNDLQIAVSLSNFIWSMTTIIGGLLAGSSLEIVGLSGCYWIDCFTFLLSAVLIYWGTSGSYCVLSTDLKDDTERIRKEPRDNHISHPLPTEPSKKCNNNDDDRTKLEDLFFYLWNCGFGLLIFLKASAALVWGVEDIIVAQFTNVVDVEGHYDSEATPWRMGLSDAAIGLGAMIGPALAHVFTSSQNALSIQRTILTGFFVLTIGWFLMATMTTPNSSSSSFIIFLICNFVRVMGSGTVWVFSTFFLQAFVEPIFLGRILAIEYTLTNLFEAASATISGILVDDVGYSRNQLAIFGALLGTSALFLWSIYYYFSLKKKAAIVEICSIKEMQKDLTERVSLPMAHGG